jgi:hypothetical protein
MSAWPGFRCEGNKTVNRVNRTASLPKTIGTTGLAQRKFQDCDKGQGARDEGQGQREVSIPYHRFIHRVHRHVLLYFFCALCFFTRVDPGKRDAQHSVSALRNRGRLVYPEELRRSSAGIDEEYSLGGCSDRCRWLLWRIFCPILFTPEANQGPLPGLFITGPLGFLPGAVGGFLYGLFMKRPKKRDGSCGDTHGKSKVKR